MLVPQDYDSQPNTLANSGADWQSGGICTPPLVTWLTDSAKCTESLTRLAVVGLIYDSDAVVVPLQRSLLHLPLPGAVQSSSVYYFHHLLLSVVLLNDAHAVCKQRFFLLGCSEWRPLACSFRKTNCASSRQLHLSLGALKMICAHTRSGATTLSSARPSLRALVCQIYYPLLPLNVALPTPNSRK
jgi:hypothetical protein